MGSIKSFATLNDGWSLGTFGTDLPGENPKWDSGQYLKFENERTLPCRDLVARIELDSPASIVDLGCGPGNSTAALTKRWPSARALGVDSSQEMLQAARRSGPRAAWVLADIREWSPGETYDLVFSNAALHWIPRHRREIPRLFGLVSAGGALAFQIPSGSGAWRRRVLWRIVRERRWRGKFSEVGTTSHSGRPRYYYDMLSPLSRRVDIWETEYTHVLPGAEAVVEWTKGTALRPFLEQLSKEEQGAFLAEYGERIAEVYPRQPDGRVLFPFRRLFVVAYR